MKKMMFMALAAIVLCGTFASCSKDSDDDVLNPKEDDQEVKYYDYREKGFFMNGDIKVRGFFEADSIMEGYTKYVKRSTFYKTVDGAEHEYLLGYGLVVNINDFASFYSDDITYNADSTAISCNGELLLQQNNDKPYEASITARIDSIGKPHLVTCYTTVDGRKLTLQFRQTYTKTEYSDAELPKEEAFTI